MNTERILYKLNKNSSIITPFIPETPVRTRIVSGLKPDWVLRRDNMEITNPLQSSSIGDGCAWHSLIVNVNISSMYSEKKY